MGPTLPAGRPVRWLRRVRLVLPVRSAPVLRAVAPVGPAGPGVPLVQGTAFALDDPGGPGGPGGPARPGRSGLARRRTRARPVAPVEDRHLSTDARLQIGEGGDATHRNRVQHRRRQRAVADAVRGGRQRVLARRDRRHDVQDESGELGLRPVDGGDIRPRQVDGGGTQRQRRAAPDGHERHHHQVFGWQLEDVLRIILAVDSAVSSAELLPLVTAYKRTTRRGRDALLAVAMALESEQGRDSHAPSSGSPSSMTRVAARRGRRL